MSAELLDGKALAARVRAALAARVAGLREKLGRAPGLAVVLVGDDPASAVYVHNKEKGAAELGMYSRVVRLAANASQQAVHAAIEAQNQDGDIDAFLVQLPLPRHLDERAALLRIDPAKDADGLHPTNLGKLMSGLAAPRPCTPAGVMALLESAQIALRGKRAVVVGRSTIVGKPMALLLLAQDATVTLCHSRTANLAEEVGRADVVVAAVGQPGLIRGDWVQPGAVVVDVGINRVAGKLVGDVDFAGAQQRASWITPVPGGVGPMTVAMLLSNAVEAAAKSILSA